MSRPRIVMSLTSLSVFALIALQPCLTGCGGRGYQKAEAKVEAMKQVQSTLEKGKAQIDATLKSLDQVVAAAGSDPRPAFDKFTADVKALDALSDDARSRNAAMKSQSEEYFKAWEEEMKDVKNPDLAKLSDERRAKAKETFKSLQAEAQVLRDSYNAFSTDLHEIQKYLNSNLNAAGIAAATKIIDKTKESGKKVMQEIDKAQGQLAQVADELSPVKAQPGAAPAPAPAPAPEPQK